MLTTNGRYHFHKNQLVKARELEAALDHHLQNRPCYQAKSRMSIRHKAACGNRYNEVPDRIADLIILIAAGFAVGGSPTVGLLAAVVAVFVAYVRTMGASVGVGQMKFAADTLELLD